MCQESVNSPLLDEGASSFMQDGTGKMRYHGDTYKWFSQCLFNSNTKPVFIPL